MSLISSHVTSAQLALFCLNWAVVSVLWSELSSAWLWPIRQDNIHTYMHTFIMHTVVKHKGLNLRCNLNLRHDLLVLNSTLLNTNASRKLNCSTQKQYFKVTRKKTIYQSITTMQFTISMQKKKNKAALCVMG